MQPRTHSPGVARETRNRLSGMLSSARIVLTDGRDFNHAKNLRLGVHFWQVWILEGASAGDYLKRVCLM